MKTGTIERSGIVLKFGGTSMGSVESLTKVRDILLDERLADLKKIVVCSALGGVTNELISIGEMAEEANMDGAFNLFESIKFRHLHIAEQFGVRQKFQEKTEKVFKDLQNLIQGMVLIQELSSRSKAFLLSFGERLSTRLLNEIMLAAGMASGQFDSTFIRTRGKGYEEEQVNWERTGKEVTDILSAGMEDIELAIVTGFFGTNDKGHYTLLGRGGSDFTAAILAVSLGIDKVEIWTDVDGFLTADPRIVPGASVIDELGYIEASELCFFGAKVLHPKTIRPVIDRNGEVFIRNTFNAGVSGTKISNSIEPSENAAVAITAKRVHVFALDIFGTNKRKSQVFAQLFNLAQEFDVPVDMIASSEALISFCIEENVASDEAFIDALEKIAPLSITKDRRIICVVSPGAVQGRIGVAAEFFTAFKDEGISMEMYSQNNSEIAQLMVVKEEDADKGIRAIHRKYI